MFSAVYGERGSGSLVENGTEVFQVREAGPLGDSLETQVGLDQQLLDASQAFPGDDLVDRPVKTGLEPFWSTLRETSTWSSTSCTPIPSQACSRMKINAPATLGSEIAVTSVD